MGWLSQFFSESTRRRRLLEVEIVFCLLILVISLIIAVYNREGDIANRTACALRLKRLAQSFQMYAQDYDGQYPPASNWVAAILPYVDTLEVYICPSDNLPRPLRSRKRIKTSVWNYTSYWYLRPARDRDSEQAPVAGDRMYSNFVGNHAGGGNITFMDTHVRWFTEYQWRRLGFPVQPLVRRRR